LGSFFGNFEQFEDDIVVMTDYVLCTPCGEKILHCGSYKQQHKSSDALFLSGVQ